MHCQETAGHNIFIFDGRRWVAVLVLGKSLGEEGSLDSVSESGGVPAHPSRTSDINLRSVVAEFRAATPPTVFFFFILYAEESLY